MKMGDLEFNASIMIRCPNSKRPDAHYVMLSTPDEKYNVMRVTDNRALFVPPETEVEICGVSQHIQVKMMSSDEFEKMIDDMEKKYNIRRN